MACSTLRRAQPASMPTPVYPPGQLSPLTGLPTLCSLPPPRIPTASPQITHRSSLFSTPSPLDQGRVTASLDRVYSEHPSSYSHTAISPHCAQSTGSISNGVVSTHRAPWLPPSPPYSPPVTPQMEARLLCAPRLRPATLPEEKIVPMKLLTPPSSP